LVMGRTCNKLLDTIGTPHHDFNHDNTKSLVNMSYKLVTENREPMVLFLKKGIIE